MSDHDTLNFQITESKYMTFRKQDDGSVDLAILQMASAKSRERSIIAQYTIGANCRDSISRFFATARAS